MLRLTATHIYTMKILLCVPGFCSASHMSDSINVPTCQAMISNLMYKCMCRLDKEGSRITNATRSCNTLYFKVRIVVLPKKMYNLVFL